MQFMPLEPSNTFPFFVVFVVQFCAVSYHETHEIHKKMDFKKTGFFQENAKLFARFVRIN